MVDTGFTLDSLLSSLSNNSTSSDLAAISLTAKSQQTKPLLNYYNFNNHMFFGDAYRRYTASLDRLLNEYPIGLAGASVVGLDYDDVLSVDEYFKKSDGFDIWLIEELSKENIENIKKYSITAAATNTKGEQVPLIHIIRDADNNLIDNDQINILDTITERITKYEEESIEIFPIQSGTATWINSNNKEIFKEEIIYPSTAEREVSRFHKLENLLPKVLFLGDEDNILKKTLDAFAEQLDELKIFADYMQYNKVISYDDYDRVPDFFLPVIAREFGVELYDSASKINIDRSLINSSSGGFTSRQVTNKIWNRIVNNISHLLKTKGTRETIEAITRIYGVDKNFIKINEYSVFSGPVKIREIEEIDVPVLYSDGTNYVSTTIDASNGSSLSFDFPASQDFTIQARVSLTSGVENTIIKHPYYSLKLDNEGQLTFSSVTTPTVTAVTPKSSISSFMETQGNFVNIAASRSGDTLSVYLTALYESSSGGEDYVFTSSASYTDASVVSESYDSVGGTVGGSTEFPANGLFDGYIHEVRSWSAALLLDDIKEHTRNFESVSIENSLTAATPVTFGNLKSHFKLKENTVIKNPYNFIVNSITAGSTATPVGFNTTEKNYKVFSDHKKITNSYPVGLYPDNDKIRQDEVGTNQEDVSFVSFSLNPIDTINRNIKNYIQDVNIFDLLGKAEDHNLSKYTSEYVNKWHEISSLWNERNSLGASNNAFDYTDYPTSGTVGSVYGLVDLSSYIKSLSNFNDTFGGLFTFSKQFLPARVNIISEGVFIEPHIFERNKIKRRFGYRFNKITEYTDETLSGDGNVFSLDHGSSGNNALPSVVEQDNFELAISNKYTRSDLAYDDPNLDDLTASAATTATFQGYQYTDNPIQEILENNYKNNSDLGNLTKFSSVNFPSFSPTRSGRFLPIRTSPAAPDQSEVEITLDQVIISATAIPDSAKGFISGRAKIITNGKSFKTESNSLKFDFPVSADGTNLFVAEVGDIEAGQGRIVKEKDTSISIPLPKEEIQFKLVLADVVTSLSAVAGNVTQSMVENSISGSLGVVPIKITNLFNNLGYIIRVAINSDSSRDTDFIRQINQQGVEKVRS